MTLIDRLQSVLAEETAVDDAAGTLQRLVRLGLDRLPLPGGGDTLGRWRALAAVAAHDLSLAKLYEGHTDALAILAELGESTDVDPSTTWGVWAAEAPEGRTVIESATADRINASDRAPTQSPVTVTLDGAKCWCSGAAGASDALLTAWYADGRGPQLVRVPLRQQGVVVSAGGWHAVGMNGSASLDVRFNGAKARLVGGPGDYLNRPGFWQGGAGVAACWYGGTLAIAAALRRALADAPPTARTPFRLAALGKVDLALSATAALLRQTAAWIDAHPRDDASEVTLRVRLAAEDSARRVLDEVGRALGAAPFCRDAKFAQAAADLPVFVRQSHAEKDFATLAELIVDAAPVPGRAASEPATGASRTSTPPGVVAWML